MYMRDRYCTKPTKVSVPCLPYPWPFPSVPSILVGRSCAIEEEKKTDRDSGRHNLSAPNVCDGTNLKVSMESLSRQKEAPIR